MVVEPTPVTNELLDEMSGQGDPVADDVIARQFEWMRSQSGGMAVDEPSDLVRRMAAHMRLPRGPVVSPYEEYLARDDARLPDWATDDDADHLERRAVSFFECHALH